MEITTETNGNRTDVHHHESGEFLGHVWHKELSGTFKADDLTFDLLADAIEHIANILPNRVRAGALIMDSIKPGWASLIDTDKLDVQRIDKCIIGQAFGLKLDPNDYGALWSDWKQVSENLPLLNDEDGGFSDENDRYDTLKALWILEIDRRKNT